MGVLNFLKELFKPHPILNIQKEFKRSFGFKPEKLSEYKVKNKGKIYITHDFETENYAKIFVLTEVEDDAVLDEVISQYIGILTISVQRPIYYETFIKTI